PLKDGCLIAQDNGRRRAFFYDGDAWHEHPHLRDLVEKRHEKLARLIDNRRWGRDFYAKLRVDDAGRTWLVEWMKGGVWDGKRWLDLVPALDAALPGGKFDMFYFLIPLPGGQGMLATSGLTSSSHLVTIDDGRVKVAPARLPDNFRLSGDYTTRS